ncbi:MAG: 5-(carboxyamino)imidazole ribonucleotide mutase [Anaerolineae bacterium]|nr:5-(carboxyamino)imidazole ribonucleotide mutase [Anaerolineae bacterium]
MSVLVPIIMGSKADLPFAERIAAGLERFGVPHELRIASAHKSVEHLLRLLADYEARGATAYVTVAGRSNALSGLVDAQVTAPVIACPPYSEAFAGADIYSSLRMPKGVAPLVVLDPEGAALAAAKIAALEDKGLRARVAAYRAELVREIEADDASLGDSGA